MVESCKWNGLEPEKFLFLLFRFDERISSFAEQKFQRDGIEVLMGSRVVNVSDKFINMKMKSTGEVFSVPHGMVLWSTGVGSRPVVKDFMEQIGQVVYYSVFQFVRFLSIESYHVMHQDTNFVGPIIYFIVIFNLVMKLSLTSNNFDFGVYSG